MVKRGRPVGTGKPAVFTATFRMMLTPEQKAWVEEQGGVAYLRRLIDADRERRQAAKQQTDY